MATHLVIWTVCFNPSDAPGLYTLHGHKVTRHGTEPLQQLYTSPTLEGIRDFVPFGLVCLGREPGDDPAIVESWI